ncbi:MAG: nitroreductase family protein [Pseudomonadota bacterium]
MAGDSRVAAFPVAPLFLQRWSPRAFSGEAIEAPALYSLFEAARWAPSAQNAQPWRFIYALRETPAWGTFHGLLNEGNQRWAAHAAALVLLVSKTTQRRRDAPEPVPSRSHSLDAGAAWASLAFQAEHDGWRTHAIGGFDRARARQALNIPEVFHLEVMIAIGRQANAHSLPDDLRQREQPTQRRPLADTVAQGSFAFTEA